MRRTGLVTRRPGARLGGGLTPPVPGLTLWLRADVGLVTAPGPVVSAWADQSGYDYDVSQVNPARRPNYVSSDPNLGGRPSIRFDVANNSLDMANSPTFAWVACVTTHPGTGGSAVFVNFDTVLVRGDANDFLIGDDGTANWATAGSAIAGTRYRNGSATNVALTSVNAPQYYEFVPDTPAAGALRIGGRASTILDWQGTIAEVFGMANVPSAGTRATLREYVSNRYGFAA